MFYQQTKYLIKTIRRTNYEKVLLVSTTRKIILKVEVTEWYKINLCKENWRKFNNSDTTNIFSSINIEHSSFAIKLANLLLENGIWCRVRFNDSYLVQLASYWLNGNIFVVPVLENNKHYLYFIVKY